MTTLVLTQGSGAATIADEPVRASCTVGETVPANPPAGFRWRATPPVQTIASVAAAGNSVSFVNPLIAIAAPVVPLPVPVFGNWLRALSASVFGGIRFLRLCQCF